MGKKMKGAAELLVLAGLLIVAVLAARGGLKAAGFEGFTTLSLSNIKYQSNDADLSGDIWTMLVSLDGSGQYATGGLEKSQITADGKTAAEGFTLKMAATEHRLEYPIRNDFSQFYWIRYENIGFGKEASDCTARGGSWSRVVGIADVLCFYKVPSGSKGVVLEGNELFKANIELSKAGGATAVAALDNIGQTSARIGDVGYARWQGSLVTGQQPPSAASQGICALYNGGWKTISCSDYEAWRNAESTFTSCISAFAATTDSVAQCVQTFNVAFNTANTERKLTTSGGGTSRTEGAESAGKVVIDLDRQFSRFTFPVFTLKVKAAWIGVVVPVGRPKIIGVASSEFKTGDSGFIKVTLQNVGDGKGSFDVAATSCSGSFSSNDRSRVQLDPAQTIDVFLALTASVTTRTTGTCAVTAIDINQPANKDSALVVVSASTIAVCRAGEKVAQGRYVQQCNINGSGWAIIKTCTEGELANAVTFDCEPTAKGSVAPAGCGLLDIGCYFKGVTSVIGTAVLAIIAVLVLLIVLNLTKR